MAQVTIGKGFDVDYYLDQVGADYYLTAAGEPPGTWFGKGAEALGLRGQVGQDEASKETMRALFHYGIGPDGIPLSSRQQPPKYQVKAVYAQVEEAIAKRIAQLGRFATAEEKRDIRLQERAKMRTNTPFYDATFSAEKSVSLMYASLRAAAKQARDEHHEADAEQLETAARAVEGAVVAGADEMVARLEQRAAFVRTGHHSTSSGEFRDAAGFVGVKFPQHTSRDDDPQLHVQAVILNKAQREDGADDKWRALDGRHLWKERLGAAAHAGVREAEGLARLGFGLVKRQDGNGWEIGGVDPKTMAAYSSRAAAIEERLDELLLEYRQIWGRAPDRAALYKLRKRVTLETRRAKSKPKQDGAGTPQDREAEAEAVLLGWIRKARDANVQELASLREAVEAWAAEHPEARPEQMPSEEERNRVIRSAISEVQRFNATWTRAQLEFELYRAMPALPADADWNAYLDAMADDALTGRVAGTDVLRIAPVPDLVDVSALDHRKDGTSVYRPPGEAMFVCSSHVDTEEWLLEKATRGAVRQRVTEAEADAALADSELDPQQRAAVKGMLTSTRFITCLVAPAGTGKTRAMAEFSKIWRQITGGRVICLTLSENAARVAAKEGFTEAWNIARFFANKVYVGPDDVLVIDEASQASTRDMARIASLALQSQQPGARLQMVGDTQQLPAVEAGGMFPLIAKRAGFFRLTEVRRFEHAWERAASLRIRDGDVGALAEYAARGRIWEGPQDRVWDEAVDLYMADVAQGRDVLLLAGSNEEAAQLARMIRNRRIERGEISGRRELTLRDGNPAGVGDLLRARLNAEIDAGGRRLTNRDILRIRGFVGTGNGRFAVVERQIRPGEWSAPFDVSLSYLTENAELAYAGNVYVAQGATVDVVRLVVSQGMGRETFYVGTSRGRLENTIHVPTGPRDPSGMDRAERDAWTKAAIERAAELYRAGDKAGAMAEPLTPPDAEGMKTRAPWESVLADILHKDDPELTALEQIKAAQEFATNTRHLLTLSEAFWWKLSAPQVDEAVRARVSPREYERYLQDPERPALLQALRAHEIGGRSIEDSLDAITARPLTGLRSIAAGLHGRLGKEPAPAQGETKTWSERTPGTAPEQIQETAGMLDSRQAALGREVAANPPHWALQAWGVPPAEAGALREDWERRAGIVESYREAAGINDPRQAIGPVPASQAQLREAFHASVRALALPDDEALLRAMGRGDLEARMLTYERTAALAPRDVAAELEAADRQQKASAAQAEAAQKAGDKTRAINAGILAEMQGREVADLRVADAARREWAEAHAQEAVEARQAESELRRRDLVARGDMAEVHTEGGQSPDPEPADGGPAAAAESEADFQARLHQMVHGAEGSAEPGDSEPGETDLEPADGGPAAEAESEADFRARLDQMVLEAEAEVQRMPDREAEQRAEVEAAGVDEPVLHGPQPEPELEATWQPGEDSSAHEAAADTEAEAEL